uniref:hypothetical protein n=1 Tax=Limosilactobacillus reuteri TaxID=1598 RepID=UPI0002E70E46|nr:hypothetical protein [Limosilactobacillus reuteri]
MGEEKTSKYYFESAEYWLKKMANDVRNRDFDGLKLHYRNLGEALEIAKIAKKKGD